MGKRLNICIFEDEFTYRLLPLVYLRPVYDLRCGMMSIREKIARMFPSFSLTLHCRSVLEGVVRMKNPKHMVNQLVSDSYLFINGRALPDGALVKLLRSVPKEDMVFVHGPVVVAAFLSGENLELIRASKGQLLSVEHFGEVPKVEVEADLISFPWDLIHKNGSELLHDYRSLAKTIKGPRIRGEVYAGVHVLGKRDVILGKGSVLKPGVVLDAENGPIVISENVKVFPQATIIGPAFIGSGSVVKVGAQIYENTSIGPVCKVGGEIEGTIIHGYSNKQHSGFLGHSYLGEWVNLGADTNNSDLKNNYSTVKVDLGIETVDSKSQFVGLMMGDHSKSGINSMFNTGTVVGAFCNVFGSGFPAKHIPSFSWGGAEGLEEYSVNRALEVARRVMSRRGITLSPEEENLIRALHKTTEPDRVKRDVPTHAEALRHAGVIRGKREKQ